MNHDDDVLLSVRGEARQTVAPDVAVLVGSITATRSSKADAIQATALVLDNLTAELVGLGGVPLTVESVRSTLTWSAFSARTQVEREHEPKTGRHEPTGRIIATVSLILALRDFGLLDALGAVIARQDEFHVQRVAWHVADDNPAWSSVRAAAIEAAMGQGRDYAAALGGSLTRIEHIADVGLLGGSAEGRPIVARAASARLMSGGGDEGDTPSLDPVPQEVTAVIEARFVASGVRL
jgi:uncharacterized protein YggE